MNQPSNVGLCEQCHYAKKIVSAKASTFWLCLRSESDTRFRKYPPLPVLRCVGFEPFVVVDILPGAKVEDS